jgi:hypothetical protein
MKRRAFLKASSIAAGAMAVDSQFSERAVAQSESPTFRRPKTILPVPIPSPQFQHVEAGVPDTQLTREATGLLREFSTPLLFNHSHRAFFWAKEMGRQTRQKFDVELLFICAAFHDLGLLKKFSSATDRFEVHSANAVRQFLEQHGVPNARIQTAWDAIRASHACLLVRDPKCQRCLSEGRNRRGQKENGNDLSTAIPGQIRSERFCYGGIGAP